MPPSLHSLLQSGAQLIQANRLADAQKLGEALLQRHAGNALVHLYAADVADAAGDRARAIGYLELPLASPAERAPVLLRKAQLLLLERRRAEAHAAAQLAAQSLDADEWQYRTLAQIFNDCLDPAAAQQWLAQGHARLPGNAAILSDLAMAEFHLNRVDDADRHIAELLEIQPFHPGALHLRSALRTQTPAKNHVQDLQQRLAQQPQRTNFVVAASFALAKEYEDLQQYDSSFNALARGARAYRGTLQYDSQTELAAQAAIRARFTPQAVASLSAGFDAAGPIFIIGMPRTGTTLVERILTSHSRVASVGELTDFPALLTEMVQERLAAAPEGEQDIDASLRLDFSELGRRYAESARQLADDRPYFVDKLPYNFLYCGYLLAALPRARIIHLQRDPMDTCYAVFKTLFFNAYSFSYDFDELADYYIGYRAHMAHWHQVLPGRILDVTYEELVRDPRAQSQRILGWCDLPWEESVLTFHEQDRPSMTASAMQVRQPVYTHSIGAWRRVEAQFAPLRDRLAQAGLLASNDTPDGHAT